MKYWPLIWLLATTPILCGAQGVFDGTWRTQVDKVQFPKSSDVYELDKIWFDCKSCRPPYRIKADGTDQPVAGHASYDTVSIRVIDNLTVQIIKKLAGKTASTDVATVDTHGNSLTEQYTEPKEGNPVTSVWHSARVAAGAADMHPLSGSWQVVRLESMSDSGTTTTITTNGNAIGVRFSDGTGFDARLDEMPVPMLGDPEHKTVSIGLAGSRTLEGKIWRAGVLETVFRMTVAADGESLEAVSEDKRDGLITKMPQVKIH